MAGGQHAAFALHHHAHAETIDEVEQWASTRYADALNTGDRLTSDERQAVIDRLARYTGLPKTYIDDTNLRVKQWNFCKELLRDQKRTVGRLDGRFKGIDVSGVSEAPDYDPSEAASVRRSPPCSTTTCALNSDTSLTRSTTSWAAGFASGSGARQAGLSRRHPGAA